MAKRKSACLRRRIVDNARPVFGAWPTHLLGRANGAVASAAVLHTVGRGFESLFAHHLLLAFCHFFQINPTYRTKLKNVWHANKHEIPSRIHNKLINFPPPTLALIFSQRPMKASSGPSSASIIRINQSPLPRAKLISA